MVRMGKRERQVLTILAAMQRTSGGIGPTLREVGDLIGCGKSAVWNAVRRLEASGLVSRIPFRASALEVTRYGLLHVREIEFDGCCWGFIPVSRLATSAHGQRSAREPASQ